MGDPTAIEFTDQANSQDPLVRRMIGHTRHGNVPFDVPFITHVAGNLYTGGCEDGLVLPRFIQHVISLYPWERYYTRHELDSNLTVRQYDSRDEVDSCRVTSLVTWAGGCEASGPTLIHCQAGLNRSALIAALVLVRSCFVADGEEAIALLREKRSPAVLCNPTFEQYVREEGALS